MILKIVPSIVELGSVDKSKIFQSESRLLRFYATHLGDSLGQVKKAAWSNLEPVILYFQDSINRDEKLLESMLQKLTAELVSESPYLYESLECLVTLLCINICDSRPSKFKHFGAILANANELLKEGISYDTEPDLQLLTFRLLDTIIECGISIQLSSLAEMLEHFDFEDKLDMISIAAIKPISKIAFQLKCRIRKFVEQKEQRDKVSDWLKNDSY